MVPLNFKWPMNEVWKGYCNPYRPTKCKSCDSSGLNPKTKKLQDDWYSFGSSDRFGGWCYNLTDEDVKALLDEGRLMDFTREDKDYIPSAGEVNAWARKFIGHDSINQWVCVKARAEREGFYGNCEWCVGIGHYWADDKFEKLYEEWEWIEPPEGEGYQLWENTSEGSPISPVFKTMEELCVHAADNCTTFGSSKTTAIEWRKMLDEDFVVHKVGNALFI